MPQLGRIMPHFHLVQRMAQAIGADVVAAHRNGRLEQQDWAQMIHACRGCEWAHACTDWLHKNENVEKAPVACPNRAMFAAIKVGSNG